MGYRFDIRKTSNQQYYWRLVAPNGETMCHSETYTTKQSAKSGAESVKANASTATILDLTGE